jgi:hypothetical protein
MRFTILLVLLVARLTGTAQVINGYAQVTAISGNVLTIGTSNETATTFTVGKSVVIMQMQDDVIGANTGNNASFGDLSNIQQAGRFTVRSITAVSRSGAVLTGVTLDAAPGIAFNLGANSAVQIVTYELLGGGGVKRAR